MAGDRTYPDAFALKNSGLDRFLFAEIGPELNGATLTMLSALARLGFDPWDEAARWARLPQPALIERLVESIRQMPLCPPVLLDARAIALRLMLLLPSAGGAAAAPREAVSPATTGVSAIPRWVPLTVFYCALALGMAVNMMVFIHPPTPASTPVQHTVQHAEPPHAG